VWLALAIDKHFHHDVADEWLKSISVPGSVHFCRATQQSFLRLLTNASAFLKYGSPPLTNQEAWRVYDTLLANERIMFSSREPDGLEIRWRRFAGRFTASPNLWMDAYLAAFAVAGGYRFVTFDDGFKQFDGLDLVLLGSL
jgi:uncharacterized protein